MSSWVTRREVADLLGVSVQTVMAYEQRKLLTPEVVTRQTEGRGMREIYVYDPREVAKLPARKRSDKAPSAGEIAARSFELFDEGSSLREVVKAVRITPDKAQELHVEWLDMGGADLVINAYSKDVLEKLLGSFNDIADLVELVRKQIR